MRTRTLLATILALPLADSAIADTIIYTGSFNGVTDVTNQLIQVQKFNPSLGTLTNVSLLLDSAMASQLTATNDGNFYGGWDRLTYTFSLAGVGAVGGIGVSANGSNQRVVGSGLAGSGFTIANMQNVVGAFGTASDPESNVATGPGAYLWTKKTSLTASNTFNPGISASYVGTGFLEFLLTTDNLHSFSVAGTQTAGVPPSSQSLSTTVLANVRVTYTYTPVPVPAAVWLLASALVGMGTVSRKRRAI